LISSHPLPWMAFFILEVNLSSNDYFLAMREWQQSVNSSLSAENA